MDQLKRQAAARALEDVRDGMQLGLGTGSTAKHFVELLGERVRAGLKVIGVPTSEATRLDAMRCGVPLTTLDEIDHLDITVDGADEIDPELNLIKGGGGALLREKIVAAASDRMIVIADESKWVEVLGRFPLPIEVVPFGLAATRSPSSSTKCLAVEPVPSPSCMPSRTSSRARAAACRFNWSMFTMRLPLDESAADLAACGGLCSLVCRAGTGL